jgi:hypothetical protein
MHLSNWPVDALERTWAAVGRLHADRWWCSRVQLVRAHMPEQALQDRDAV